MKMKTIKSFIIVVLISVLIASCSIPAKTPETGIYHCDELNISIDTLSQNIVNIFSLLKSETGLLKKI
jgi:hypothetical protein